jgi:esterase/lipase superfamily enzyme
LADAKFLTNGAEDGQPPREFTTVVAKIVDKSEIAGTLHRRVVRSPDRSVLVFVHGYNNRFDDSVFRFAQIVHDSGTTAIPILFTWPSAGELLSYGYDRDRLGTKAGS